ncbi:MAG: quinone oxidoreductase [Alphaproteobacteria bacterium]
MVQAVRIHDTGGPDKLVLEDIDVGPPGPGEARISQAAIGLNFIDTYYRSGLYPVPSLPATLGVEGAGTVTAIGDGVSECAPGDRVSYAGALGAYSAERTIAADRLIKLPDGISHQQAAGVTLRGLTVHYLLRRTYRVKPGDTILIHAAAGGVGLLVCQWAKHLGATVIGTVGDAAKAELAKANGCDHPINYREEDFVARVRDLTGGEGVPVVYDSVGKDTFAKSLDCLQPLGLLVSFGQSSGPVAPFNILELSAKGSLFMTRPTLATYVAKREDLLAAAEDLFAVVASGAVKVEVGRSYPLAEAAAAHADLEARRTTGSTILIP